MKDFKVIWTENYPDSSLSRNRRNCIGYIKNDDNQEFSVYDGIDWATQYSHDPRDYRPATAKEIEEHWDVLHPFWNPKPGDKVIIIQKFSDWHHVEGTIIEKYAESYSDTYWDVRRNDDGSREAPFDKTDQMIIAPYDPVPSVSVPVFSTNNPVLRDLVKKVQLAEDNIFAISCPGSLEQAQDLFKILSDSDVKWNNGAPLDPETTRWTLFSEETIYILSLYEIDGELKLRLGYGRMSIWDYTKNLTIHVEAILSSNHLNQES